MHPQQRPDLDGWIVVVRANVLVHRTHTLKQSAGVHHVHHGYSLKRFRGKKSSLNCAYSS